MEKLTLKVDELAVESFEPGRAERLHEKGTVEAHQATRTRDYRCDSYFCTYSACTGLPC